MSICQAGKEQSGQFIDPKLKAAKTVAGRRSDCGKVRPSPKIWEAPGAVAPYAASDVTATGTTVALDRHCYEVGRAENEDQ
jgi:hypothetical protein